MTQQSVSDTPAGAAPTMEQRLTDIRERVEDVPGVSGMFPPMHSQLADDVRFLLSAVDALREDAARLDWLEGEGEREALPHPESRPFSLFRLNQPITRAAIDNARHTHAVRSAAEVIDPKTGKKVMDLMEALKASLNFDKSRAGSLSGRTA